MKQISADIVVIGTGMGGGIISRALAESGKKILIVERGKRLPSEPENWGATEVFLKNRYKNAGGSKGTNDVAVAEKLIGKIDEIAEIFWATKK